MRRDLPFLLDPSVVYLNHGSYGATPRPVLDAQAAWRTRLEENAVRFFDDLDQHLERARAALGALLHADADGLVFVPNATTAISTVLRSLRLSPGDRLLTTNHEYNATLNALVVTAARSGAHVDIARVPFPIGSEDEAVGAILERVTSRTRVALVSHVTSPTALVLPIERIVRELAGRGAMTLVDAAHAPGMVDVDVDATGAAWWTANGHKWLCGPKGSAVLWTRANLRDATDPLVISHGWNDVRVARGDRLAYRARFDWTGTSDPTPYLALADAIRLVGALEPGGWAALTAANRALALEARVVVAEALAVDLPAPDGMIGSMASLPLPGLSTDEDADELHAALRVDGIEVPVVGWPVPAAREPGAGPTAVLIRISAQRYNEPSDYEALAAALTPRLSRLAAR